MGAPNPDVSSPISQANKDPKVQKPNASTATVCILINIINNNTSNISNNNNDKNNRSPTTLRKFKSDIYIYFTPYWCIRVPRNVYGRRSVPKEKPRTDSRPYLNAYGQQSVQERLRTKFSLFDLVHYKLKRASRLLASVIFRRRWKVQ